jgi:branched-chain amino acid transport system ATP-binding protein
MMKVLEVKNLEKRFPGVKALDGVNLSVEQGEIRGLIGPNGSGKTTLIRTIMGFYKQDKGEIIYNGDNLDHLEIWARVDNGLSLTYQTPAYVSGLSIYRHIELGTLARKWPKQRILEIAKQVGLEDALYKDPSELPVLSAKRLEVAKALSTGPEFLMIDEVFAGLSFEEGEEMIRILKKLNSEKNITIMLIDHNLSMVKKMVEKTTVIDMGRIIAEGSFEEIIEDQTVRKAYVG